jgi:DNA-binding HxlR family transcriptional regulator
MAIRSYGQYCGVSHAVELLGQRWALLVVRDLLSGPKRFTDLQRGLPGIPTNVLSSRLKELEEAGVVRRQALPRPPGGVAYELTEYGGELEPVVRHLMVWGAKSLGEPGEADVTTSSSLALGLQLGFRPEAAKGLAATYELRIRDAVVQVRIEDGELTVVGGAPGDPDLIVESDLVGLRSLMLGELDPEEAVSSGLVRLEGDTSLFERFAAMFGTPAVPGGPPPAATRRE